MNWRGTPLVSLAAIVGLIASTHSHSGLRVRSEIDRRRYSDGLTVTDAQMATVRLKRHEFRGDWNYMIHPASRRRHKSVLSRQLVTTFTAPFVTGSPVRYWPQIFCIKV
jgi:hypothetical protein